MDFQSMFKINLKKIESEHLRAFLNQIISFLKNIKKIIGNTTLSIKYAYSKVLMQGQPKITTLITLGMLQMDVDMNKHDYKIYKSAMQIVVDLQHQIHN